MSAWRTFAPASRTIGSSSSRSAPGVGDLRLAAQRTEAPRHPARNSGPCERFPESDTSAIRSWDRGQVGRDPGASRLAQADNDLIANERDIATAQASLNRTLGRIIGAPIAPLDSLDVPPPLPDSATIEQIALANRPELAILQNQRQGAQASTSLIKQFWYPDLTLPSSAITRSRVRPSSPWASRSRCPTFYWQHARGDIAQAQHFERELEATYRDARAQVTQDVRSAYANASTAMRQVVFLRDQLVPAAREAYRVASTSYTSADRPRSRCSRRAALCSTRNANSLMHSHRPTPPVPISIAPSAPLSRRSPASNR